MRSAGRLIKKEREETSEIKEEPDITKMAEKLKSMPISEYG